MANGSEKYQADRENNREQSSEAGKKTAKVAAKAAADYFTGGKGGAIVDKLADTKLGNQILNQAGKVIDKDPIVNKAARKLNDSGALDAADKGLSMVESGGSAKQGEDIKALSSDKDSSSLNTKNSGVSGPDFKSLFGQKKNTSLSNSLIDETEEEDYSASSQLSAIGSGISKQILGKLSFKTKLIIVGCGVLLFFVFCIITVILINKDMSSDELDSNSTNNNGACTYHIKGFRFGNSTIDKQMEISNLKVRLMECGSPYGNGSYTTPLNEPLIDFETYIAGVANAEIGSDKPAEAIKAQMVAARSYSLARPTAMNNALGKKLETENGQWILQISSCVADHVFCNIDEGCSYMGGGDGQGGIVRSGNVSGAIKTRPALATDHILRTLAQEVKGKVLVDKNGYIISTGYVSTEQHMFENLAIDGLDYKQILLQVYNQGNRNYGAYDIQQMPCTSASVSTGEFSSWKQYGSSWSNIKLGSSNKTIGSSGCLVTSIAMLIAKSGVQTNVDGQFDPGTFVQKLNANGGFSGADFWWGKVSVVAPNFVYQDKIDVAGWTREAKLNKINELLNNGYYITAEVKGKTGQHWVAIDSISGDTINIMDPGSDSTNMWEQYNWANTSTLGYFKVS